MLFSLTELVFRYKVVLDSDAEQYNGHKRIDPSVQYHTVPEPWDNRRNNMHVCILLLKPQPLCHISINLCLPQLQFCSLTILGPRFGPVTLTGADIPHSGHAAFLHCFL